MPECRVELFVDATEHDPMVVIGDIAHVEAAADGGPRASPVATVEERNDYENLLLLCKTCHTRVDGQPVFHSVSVLKDIKHAHEAWVRASLPERGRSTTGWTPLVLRGDHPLDMTTIDAALAPDFPAVVPSEIQVPTDTANWQAVDTMLAAKANGLLAADDAFDLRIAVFPIAPVSACISLGYHLTSRPNVRAFQHDRDARTWAWPKRAVSADEVTVTGLDRASDACAAVAFVFHLSAPITDDALIEAGAPIDCRVDFRISKPTTTWLQNPAQIVHAASEARRAFEMAMQLFPNAKRWHVFYAGPAPLAVAIGQQINPTMYPTTQLYEYRHKETPKYRPTIHLGST